MTDTGDALAPGTRLDELEIERVLGAGGFGVTYLARDVSLDAWRAVKEYLPRDWGTRLRDGTIGPRTGADAEDYQWGLTRFLDEARVLAKFDHPHLVRVHRVFEAQGTAYMVTEYVEGQTLSAALQASGPWSEGQVRELLEVLTDGLAVVHGAGLLHRDIKPGNVMVRGDGTPVLIDFGSARQAMGRQSRSVTAVLTPGYAPLEQYSPRGNQGPWTDIYALGALAYEALSGQVPDDATERVRADRLRPVDEVAPQSVSAGLAAAITAALAVDEEDRPQSLDAWRELLAGTAGVSPVSSRPRGGKSYGAAATGAVGGDVVSERSGRPAAVALAWRRWWLPGAAGAGLVVVALVVALTAPWNGTGSEETPGLPAEPAGVAELGENVDEPGSAGEPGADVSPGQPAEPEEVDPAQAPESAPPPAVLPAAVEEALGLDRAARREIQAGLSAAGFDVGVADGRFGAGTRAGLREWQAAAGVPATGYLDAETAAALRAAAIDAEAQRLAELRQPGRVFRDCPSCPEMVVLPGGDLALGQNPVTVGEYRAFASATGGGAGGGCVSTGDGDSWRDPGFPQTDRHPVTCVSWDDAQEYVSWLSRTAGGAYRLPTEAEWESADAGSQRGCDRDRTGNQGTCPVGTYGSNAAGLSDMVGNLWEWTEDCWDGDCGGRVVRGAAWIENAEIQRLGMRFWDNSGLRNFTFGFRVARTLDQAAAAQAAAEQPRLADMRRPGREFRDCPSCPEMVVLPGSGLALGQYEVTVGEYRAFASATGGGGDSCLGGDSWRDPGFAQTDRHPVTCVSWDDAEAYVTWLSRTAGSEYRLPTEAEWESAAAGSQRGCDRERTGDRGTCPVGSYGTNAAGLSDMVGNLWEWTEDCWEGDCSRRVMRGGSWYDDAEALRPGARNWNSTGNRFSLNGFRVARTLGAP